ncbi:MAG TPA: TonB-dependent receptor [Rhizomicrobium sp.]|nr:TonB-dependent receptor [Rhizomicrobium sp.]
MPEAFNLRRKSVLLGCTAMAAVMLAGSAMADDTSAPETVVVTGTRFNTDAAPAKASLDTTEPQTIINRTYIENFLPPQADYVSILAIVPSMTGGDINGPGLSDGGTKNTLRGLPDGDFVQTYDGIPFGDTNGPTHHNISYFPASTIGSIVVDRGPGNAGTLGAATYGGSVAFFSEGLTDDMHARVVGSYGSFNTVTGIANFQTGDLDTGGFGTVRAMTNLQYVHSDGALTNQDLFTNNVLLKVQDELNSHWTVTLFGDSAFLKENLDDNNGDTPGQIALYGKDFALQDTNPALPTYTPYNYTSKHTDMDYARLQGDQFGVKVDNTVYTYAYWNHTFSPNNQTQTYCDALNNTSEGNYPGGGWTTNASGNCVAPKSPANSALVLANGTTDPNAGMLAYSKENAYRVYGDIFRLSEDYDLGWIDGQIREGVWWETQATHRFKYYYDSISCTDQGIDPFDTGDAAANAACGVAYKPFAGAYTGTGGKTSISSSKSILNGDLGFAKDDEHSDWTQYEPFVEVDIKALDDRLTITPGLKYIHWDHGVDAPVGQGNLCGVGANSGTYNKTTNPEGTNGYCTNAPGENYTAGFITRDLLPFLEMNYKLEPSWSIYFQYAKGIYVPDITAFENSPPTGPGGYPAPETTTNYQLGTVYYADQFTFDADVYYIPIHNNYVVETCSYDSSESCYVNNGSATYQGIEGEGTYAFDTLFGYDVHGLSAFANGALMSSKADGGLWEPNAPMWTAAAGILYQSSQWKFGLIDKLVGPQYSDTDNLKYYELHTYGNLTATAGYALEWQGVGSAELSLNVDNLLDSRKDTLITEATNNVAATSWQNSLDQYFFQAPRSIFVNLTLRY